MTVRAARLMNNVVGKCLLKECPMKVGTVIPLLDINLLGMGCATKRHVRNEVTPLISAVNDLDSRTFAAPTQFLGFGRQVQLEFGQATLLAVATVLVAVSVLGMEGLSAATTAALLYVPLPFLL